MNPLRLAIFVSGPVRYAGLVQQRLADLLSDHTPAFFFHLWKCDLSNKVRQGYESDWRMLPPRADTKVCLLHDPYDLPFYSDRIGSHANTNSTINAVIGMYLGLAQLCAIFRTLPDRDTFTHILRVRSDCAFTCDSLRDLISRDRDAVVLSHDAGLPADGWASDHILCAPVEHFLRIYEMPDIAGLYAIFEKGKRNPEKMLRHLLDSRLPQDVRVVGSIQRYLHYHLVYSPPRPTDSAWVRALVDAGKLPELFLESAKHRSMAEDEATVSDQAENWAPARDPYRNPVINHLRKLKHRFLKWQ